MARDEKIVIRLTEDVKQRFQDVADEMGMTISALGSYVVGDYLRRLENEKTIQTRMVDTAVNHMASGMQQVESDQLSKVFEMMARNLKN